MIIKEHRKEQLKRIMKLTLFYLAKMKNSAGKFINKQILFSEKSAKKLIAFFDSINNI